MLVYWSEQYTFDFSPYLRHIFAVKHIYLTLYIVYALRVSPIYSVPPALAVRAATRPRGRARAPACVCVRVCAWACVCAAVLLVVRATVRSRVCAWACVCAALASVVRVILFAYMVDSPAVLPRAGLAVNFFEIVFKPLISVQLSSA